MNKERLPLSLLALYKETFISSVGCLEEIGRKLESIGYLVNELKALGFGIALDDFGTENSSFQKLNIIRPDIVKLDRFFLREGKDMISWVAEGLKSSGYKILIEGIETEEDIRLMDKLQPDFVQGFYYGKPIGEI